MLSFGFLIALLLILDIVTHSCGQSQTADSPALVMEFFRHGARAPLNDMFAKDWPAYQLGELTTIGMREHYMLGAALANDYPDILGQPYNLSKIYVRSSVLTRSIDSALSQLYGVYEGHGPALNANSSYPSERAFPPYTQSDLQQINQNLNNSQAIPGGFIPIAPNTTSDEGGVTLLEPTQVCFNLLNDILENVLSEKALNFWADNLAPTRQALQDLGINAGNPYDLGELGDAMVCDYYDGRALPGNIDPNSQLYKNVTFARDWFFTLALWGTEDQRQLLSVPLLNYVLNYFDSKIAGNTEFNFMFESTAETNLLDVLATFNIVTEQCLMDNYLAELAGQDMPHPNCNYTEFASNIIFELYTNDSASSVIFKYNGVAIPLCNNQAECSYDDFKNFVTQSTNGNSPDKYKRDCLGRSLPKLQEVFQQLGQAFQAADNGGDTHEELNNVFNSITGDLNDATNNGENDEEHDLGSILEHAVDDIKDIGNN